MVPTCNLIGSQKCDLCTNPLSLAVNDTSSVLNRTTCALNRFICDLLYTDIIFKSDDVALVKSHHFFLANKMRVKALLQTVYCVNKILGLTKSCV